MPITIPDILHSLDFFETSWNRGFDFCVKLALEDFSVGGLFSKWPIPGMQPGVVQSAPKVALFGRKGTLGASGVEKHGCIPEVQYGAAWWATSVVRSVFQLKWMHAFIHFNLVTSWLNKENLSPHSYFDEKVGWEAAPLKPQVSRVWGLERGWDLGSIDMEVAQPCHTFWDWAEKGTGTYHSIIEGWSVV